MTRQSGVEEGKLKFTSIESLGDWGKTLIRYQVEDDDRHRFSILVHKCFPQIHLKRFKSKKRLICCPFFLTVDCFIKKVVLCRSRPNPRLVVQEKHFD